MFITKTMAAYMKSVFIKYIYSLTPFNLCFHLKGIKTLLWLNIVNEIYLSEVGSVFCSFKLTLNLFFTNSKFRTPCVMYLWHLMKLFSFGPHFTSLENY